MSANGTSYASYASCCPKSPNYDPHARTTECTDDSACQYTGQFSALGNKSYEYVKSTNIVSFYALKNSAHSYNSLKNKYIWIRNRKNGIVLKAIVGDTCADTDCRKGPCCSDNAKKGGGYLVDIEMNTLGRFSPGSDYNNFEQLLDWKLA